MKHKFLLVTSILLFIFCKANSQIIADHTVVDKYANIPQQYIDSVKKMLVVFAGESHSFAYRKGLTLLMGIDSRFEANVYATDAIPPSTGEYLRCARQVISNGFSWSATTGESRWYANPNNRGEIKTHIKYCNDHNLGLAAIGFGWCWDMTSTNVLAGNPDPVYNVRWAGASDGGPQGNLIWGLDKGDSVLTGNSVCMDTYLKATEEYIKYCQVNGYSTKVLFTTGPLDGYTGENGYQRYLKHEYIRNYVKLSPARILFDYADIVAYNNSGQLNTTSWGGHTFPHIHDDNMLDLNGGYAEDGDHIGEQGALRIGKAVWWLLARLAGWDGGTGTPDSQAPTIPSNFRYTSRTSTSIQLAWNASTDNVGVVRYIVYRGADSIGQVSGLTYSVSALNASTSYSFTVKAKDASGNKSAASSVVTVSTLAPPDVTLPTAPSALASSNITTTGVRLSWGASTDNAGVTGYIIYRGTDSIARVTTLVYNVTGLTPSTNYTFTVKARDAAGNKSIASNAANVRTLTTPDVTLPTAPSVLASSNITTTGVRLSWGASTDNVGVTGYIIYRGTDSIARVTTLVYNVTGLTPSTNYTFTVKARDAAGNKSIASNAANVRTLTTPDVTAPSVPSVLAVSNLTTTGVQLSWGASTDNVKVTGYIVYRGADSIATVTTLQYIVTGLLQATNYTFTVKARDAAGNKSAASNSIKITTLSGKLPDQEKPSAPVNLKVASKATTNLKLNWVESYDNVGVTGYNVFVGDSMYNSTTDTFFIVSKLSPATEYSFYVLAFDAAGNISDTSDIVNGTTLSAIKPTTIGQTLSSEKQLSVISDFENNRLQLILPENLMEKVKVDIFNISGICVYSKMVNTTGEPIAIDNPGIGSGIYIITVSDRNTSISAKLLY